MNLCSCDLRLNELDRQVLTIATRRGIVGLSDVQSLTRCDKQNARFVLARLVKIGYLQQSYTGGFVPTSKGFIEVDA